MAPLTKIILRAVVVALVIVVTFVGAAAIDAIDQTTAGKYSPDYRTENKV